MTQPILTTERLVLVPLIDDHLELEVELDSDPEVLRYIWGRARTPDEVAQSHETRMALSDKVDALGFWVAFEKTEGAAVQGGDFVGLMMLPPAHGPDQPDHSDVADLGYRLLRRHWRRGYASEASGKLLHHAFETVGVSRVIAQTMSVNTGSRKVMEAVGLRYVRTYFPQFDEPLPDADQGEVEYEMTREMWRMRRP